MASLSDYYRQRQQQPDPAAPPPTVVPAAPPAPGERHAAGPFTLSLPEGWRDQSVYVFAGPLQDGIQHTITVSADPDIEELSLDDFADRQVGAMEAELKAFSVIHRGPVTLPDGTAAVRVVFDWYPVEDTRFVQEQLYIRHATTGYTLTATFSAETFEIHAPAVRAILLSFQLLPA